MNMHESSICADATVVSRSHARSRSIGAILIDSGRLSVADAEQILRRQQSGNIRFGDAGIELGLLSAEDIRYALASQFEYPCLPAGDANLSPELVAAYLSSSPVVEQLRALRSQLMLRCFGAAASHKALAIVSPGRGEGRSFIAANLAIVFSQLGERTLLIDADLRTPRLHQLFKLEQGTGLSGVLCGRTGKDVAMRILSLRGLSVLPAGVVPPNPQELLGRPAFAETLEALSPNYDIIIIDTSPANESADALTVASRAGSALMLARNNHSSIEGLALLAENLQLSGVTLVGAVLNDMRGRQ